MNPPDAAGKGRYWCILAYHYYSAIEKRGWEGCSPGRGIDRITLGGPMEADVELVHIIVDQVHDVVRHKPTYRRANNIRGCDSCQYCRCSQLHDVCLDATLSGSAVKPSVKLVSSRSEWGILIMIEVVCVDVQG